MRNCRKWLSVLELAEQRVGVVLPGPERKLTAGDATQVCRKGREPQGGAAAAGSGTL